LGIQNAFFVKMKTSTGWLKQNIFKKSKMPGKKSCRGWGSSGSFQPQAVALVMSMKK
jgi:hypothetical protein